MIRVALETSTPYGSVAVGRGERVLSAITLGEQSRHAERVVPALERALALAGAGRSDIGEVVVGGGPGSFTGVRVAGATARGLVAGLEVPLVAYSSLLALAAGVPADRPVCALLDARRGEVYAGCWRVARRAVEMVLEPMVGPVEDVVEATRAAAPLFVGDGALRYRDALGDGVPDVPAHPRATTLLWLAHHHRALGDVDEPAAWEPAYLRASSAERGIAG